MEISKRLQEKTTLNRELKDTLKLKNNKIKEQADKISALATQLGIEEAKVKKWELMQANGYTAVTLNDGMITNAVTVLPYSTFTYTQAIPKEINTQLYQRFPFYILDSNQAIKMNPQKYKRYRSI